MHKHYELIIFTAAMQDYADWVIDNLDPVKSKIGRLIDFRLYR
jgi:TFIIF-interacting CTD phosphatase-like protein